MIACATFTFSYICSIFSFQVKNSDQIPIALNAVSSLFRTYLLPRLVSISTYSKWQILDVWKLIRKCLSEPNMLPISSECLHMADSVSLSTASCQVRTNSVYTLKERPKFRTDLKINKWCDESAARTCSSAIWRLAYG